jgi:hemolysin-activating ACP:hemolysin acyltransferase
MSIFGQAATAPAQTNYSLVGICGHPARLRSARAETVGHVLQLARRRPHRAKAPLDTILRMLDSAYELQQIKLYFNDFGQCVGYVCWAWVTKDVEERLLGEPDYMPHLFEWNEGTRLWILDFCAARGSLARLWADMRDVLFPAAEAVNYVRMAHGSRRKFNRILRSRSTPHGTSQTGQPDGSSTDYDQSR